MIDSITPPFSLFPVALRVPIYRSMSCHAIGALVEQGCRLIDVIDVVIVIVVVVAEFLVGAFRFGGCS